MIVKNEATKIRRCLRAVMPVCDELIIVDTGSTDETVRIVSRFQKAKIIHFRWIDDFAAARNEALRHATKDLVLSLDADECIGHAGLNALRALKRSSLENLRDYYICQIHSHFDFLGRPTMTIMFPRVFKKSSGPKWKYRVFEQLEFPSGAKKGYLDLEVYHRKTQDEFMQSSYSYLKILRDCMRKSGPALAYYRMHYGALLNLHGRYAEAKNHLKSFLAIRSSRFDQFHTHYHLAVAYFGIGDVTKASRHVHRAIQICPVQPATYLLAGMILESQGKLREAKGFFERVLELHPAERNSVGRSALRYNQAQARAYLSALCLRLEDYRTGLDHAARALRYSPDLPLALVLKVLNEAMLVGNQIVAACERFSEAEIGQAIVSAFCRSSAKKRPLDTELLLQEMRQMISCPVTCREDIERMREIAHDRFVNTISG